MRRKPILQVLPLLPMRVAVSPGVTFGRQPTFALRRGDSLRGTRRQPDSMVFPTRAAMSRTQIVCAMATIPGRIIFGVVAPQLPDSPSRLGERLP
jgi:hypothetical protein